MSDLHAKAPGVVSCYRDICHRVRTIEETREVVGRTTILETSFYDDPKVDRFVRGQWTSSGEFFDPGSPGRAASSDFPDGTELLVRNPENGRTSHIRVNDFGPFFGSRRLDVTKRVAQDLGFDSRGLAVLEVTVIAPPPAAEPVYRLNRVWPAVKGYLGVLDKQQVLAMSAQLIWQSRPGALVADAGQLPPAAKPAPPSPPAVAQPAATRTGPVPLTTPTAPHAPDKTPPTLMSQAATDVETARGKAPPRTAPATIPAAPHANASGDNRPLRPSVIQPEPAPAAAVVVADASPIVAPSPVRPPARFPQRVPSRKPPAASSAPPLQSSEAPSFSMSPGSQADPVELPLVPAPAAVAVPLPPMVSVAMEPSSGVAGTLLAALALATAWIFAYVGSIATAWRVLPAVADTVTFGRLAAEFAGRQQPVGPIAGRVDVAGIVGAGKAALPTEPFEVVGPAEPVEPSPTPEPALPPSRFDRSTSTFIASDITIFGSVISRLPIILAGTVTGSIRGPALEVIVGGRLDGDVDADLVDISGTIDGRVTARVLNLRAASTLLGEARTRTLDVDAGAHLEARVRRG